MDSVGTTPFWGHPTSYLNFCEEDYVITRYIAEFINTLSSLAFVIYGVYGLSINRQRPQAVPRLVSFGGLIGVGVCSAGYHMTLKYHTQMSDELSMHLLTTPLVYRLLTFQTPPQHTKLVGLTLLTIFTAVMITHMVLDEFLLHASTFALAVYVIVSRSLRLISHHVLDPLVGKRLRRITFFGFFNFIVGYLVWLIDNWACRALTYTKHSVGLPWAFFLELHGWWHIFTAIGGYTAVAVVDMITSGEVNRDPIDDLVWPVPFAEKFMSALQD